MIRIFILIILCTLSSPLWAQEDRSNGVGLCIDCKINDSTAKPYFILILKRKQLILNSELRTLETKKLVPLHPKWIRSLVTLKGKTAITKYGSIGSNGIVEILLKRNSDKKIPVEILSEFKPINP